MDSDLGDSQIEFYHQKDEVEYEEDYEQEDEQAYEEEYEQEDEQAYEEEFEEDNEQEQEYETGGKESVLPGIPAQWISQTSIPDEKHLEKSKSKKSKSKKNYEAWKDLRSELLKLNGEICDCKLQINETEFQAHYLREKLWENKILTFMVDKRKKKCF